jgi:hypothetical protein
MPYHEAASDSDVSRQAMIGAIPLLNPIVRQRTFVERRLAAAMDRCLVRDPRERADVFWLRDYLYETKTLQQQHDDHLLWHGHRR